MITTGYEVSNVVTDQRTNGPTDQRTNGPTDQRTGQALRRSELVHSRNNFDFLRFFAASLVLISHQHVLTGRPEPIILGVHSFGGLGVLIFFSISGYLIAESWKRNPDTKGFLINRFLRIWPGFAVMILLTVFVLGPIATTEPLQHYFTSSQTYKMLRTMYFRMNYELPGVFESNPFARSVNGSIWTVPLEIKWYGILLLLGLTRVLNIRLLFTVIAAGYLAYMLLVDVPAFDKRGWTFEFGVYFVAGMLVSQYKSHFLKHRLSFAGVALLAALLAVALDRPYLALAACVPVTTLAFGTASFSILNAFGRHGDFSYGFYLYAFPIQQLLVSWGVRDLPFLVGLALAGTFTLICAVLSWYFVEGPALRLKLARPAHDSLPSDQSATR